MSTAAPSRAAGVTVVLPAYKEEANLAGTVEDMLGTLSLAGEPHHVVIVNDGSPDRTGEVADDLAARYPGRVITVHHPVNRGYGAAVRTGISTALDQTDSRRLFLTDSDGQFRAAQLPSFIRDADAELADAVIGYRRKRADPVQRKINAMLWGWACKLLLRIRARDVDCAYKLVDRRVLDGAPLRAEAGTISPELLLRAKDRGARVLQRPVEHYPRQHGEQTGAKISVILTFAARAAAAVVGAHRGGLAGPRGPAAAPPGRSGAGHGNRGGRAPRRSPPTCTSRAGTSLWTIRTRYRTC